MSLAAAKRYFDPLSLALSLMLAVLVWAYVDDRRIEIREFQVPLTVQVPEGWELEPDKRPPSAVTVRLQGPREQMKSLRASDLSVRKRLPPPAADQDSMDVPLEIKDGDIRIPPKVAVVSKTPETLDVSVVRLVPTYLRVEPNVVGQPAGGYRVLSASAEPRFVKAFLPKGAYKPGDTVQTYPVDINDKAQSLGLTVGIMPTIMGGRKIRPDADVWVSVIIEPIPQTRTLEKVPVRVLAGSLLGKRIVKVEPATATVKVEGPKSVVDKLQASDPVIYADLVNTTSFEAGDLTAPLRAIPMPDVVIKAVEPPEAVVQVR